MNKQAAVVLYLVLTATLVFSRQPLSYHYTPQQFNAHPLIWAMIQDARGILFAANNDGVLEFDGKSWRLIPTPIQVLSIDTDANGWIFVCCKTDYGYLHLTPTGSYQYRSLAGGKQQHRQRYDKVFRIPEGVCFVGTDELIVCKFNGKLVDQQVYKSPGAIIGAGKIDNAILLYLKGGGIQKFAQGKFQPVAAFAAEVGVPAILPLPSGKIIIASYNAGLFQLQGNTVSNFSTQCDAALKSKEIYTAALLPNGNIALATFSDGVYVINENGQQLAHYNKSNVLPDNNLYSCFADSFGCLWLGHGRGLTRLLVSAPIRQFTGFQGKMNAILSAQGKIWLSTTTGILASNDTKTGFEPITGIRTECWDMLEFNNRVLVSSNEGVYEIVNNKAIQISPRTYVTKMLASKHFPNRVWLASIGIDATGSRLAAIELKNGNWQPVTNISNFRYDITGIAETSNGNLVVGTFTNGVLAVNTTNNKISSLNQMKTGKTYLTTSGNSIYLQDITNFGILRAAGSVDSIALLPALSAIAGNNSSLLTADNTLYLSTERGLLRLNSQLLPDSISWLGLIAEKVNVIAVDKAANNLWFSVHDVLYQVELDHPLPIKKPMAMIRQISTQDSGRFYGQFQTAENLPSLMPSGITEFPYTQNSIYFTLGATGLAMTAPVEFSFWLEGVNSSWSRWSSNYTIYYPNLAPGNYRLQIRARNALGQISEPFMYSFEIITPWYRTMGALSLAGLGLVGIVIISFRSLLRWNLARLEAANKKLEALVQERTQEVMAQKAEVEARNKQVEVQNQLIEKQKEELVNALHEITDSIEYAQRIQHALLPAISSIQQHLPESFVYWQPRDVVSGDFYWFYARRKVLYLAAVDCTGHGVPGAFLTAIGYNTLNYVLREYNQLEVNLILAELNERIINTLNLRRINTQAVAADGMDIALIQIDTQNDTVTFAGANRPLYLFRSDGEMQELKGSPKPIGSTTQHYVERDFEIQTIEYRRGDTFYLFTDGITDQFGGQQKRKFTARRLRELLTQLQSLSLNDQLKSIRDALRQWQGNARQTDDQLMIGVRL
jgi:serine phosphatase RsbU (regulator of sigma subunit)